MIFNAFVLKALTVMLQHSPGVCYSPTSGMLDAFVFFFFLSVSQTGVRAAAAQPAEAHVAAGKWPVPRIPATPHEGHAKDRECAVVRAAAPGGGDKKERSGKSRAHTQTLMGTYTPTYTGAHSQV